MKSAQLNLKLAKCLLLHWFFLLFLFIFLHFKVQTKSYPNQISYLCRFILNLRFLLRSLVDNSVIYVMYIFSITHQETGILHEMEGKYSCKVNILSAIIMIIFVCKSKWLLRTWNYHQYLLKTVQKSEGS